MCVCLCACACECVCLPPPLPLPLSLPLFICIAWNTFLFDTLLFTHCDDVLGLNNSFAIERTASEEFVGMKRTSSEPCLTSLWVGVGQSQAKAEQTLAYWKLETKLRLAADKMLAKDEEVDELNKYRDTLEEEMGDLTCTLFEEANEMVRVEKEARQRDHILLKETQDKTSLLQAELKALKEIVAHLRKNGGAPEAYVGAGSKGGGGPAAGAAASPSGKPAPAPAHSNAARPYDTRIFNELMQWKSNPSVTAAGSEFMKRILHEDVNPCMSQ